MFNLKSDHWLGDEASLRQAHAYEVKAMTAAISASFDRAKQPGAEDLPRLYSRTGNVGVITIRGGLLNVDNFFTEIFGISTYPAIREALAFAASDGQVNQILLDIESPGGVVSGCNDCAKLIAQVRESKPVTAFSDSLMASAAYWLGSAADKVYVGETAIVGSIGVIATIVSEHDALKKEGIDVRVIRAGKNKALGHPAEPISDKAVKQVQERADAIYDVFVATVSANRSKLKSANEDTWAQGNEFLGADAVEAHLADAISSFDEVLAQLTVDKQNSLNNNPANKKRDLMKPRASLDPKLVALVQSGAPLNDEQKAEVEAARVAEAEAKAEAVKAQALADKAIADKAAADALAAAAVPPVEAAAAPADKGELVTYLEKQLAERGTELAAANAKLATAESQVAEMKPPHDALVEIACNSINTMTVGLGGRAADLKALSAKEVVARHATTLADFQKAFPIGAVAASAPAKVDAGKQDATVTSLDQSRRRMSAINPQGGK